LKPTLYAIVIFLFAVFDATVSPRIGILGTTPSLCLALTASAAVFDGKKTGSVVGLSAGFLLDALGGVGVSVSPIVWALLGWFSASRKHGAPGYDNVNQPFLKRLFNFLICLAICCAIGMAVTALRVVLTAGRINIFSLFVKILLPEAIGTFLYGLPIGLVRLAVRK
jgi:hypothetical protein